MSKKEVRDVVIAVVILISVLCVLYFTATSLHEKGNKYIKNKNIAILAIVADELDVPQREVVIKKDSNENEDREELELYTATTSKGVYSFKIKETIEAGKLFNGESKPVIENIAQVKMGSTDKKI
ncbi:hypothetical protein [Bacillus cereus group sp. BfR-BA-01317]|uniref:hypothetical protein n=1 Tax=Bacillus cereus group sp. BfR-BA-01317 TaxID=2920294 RepID=UPI001F5AEF1E|nr:hypothetical protein [Bacillus cereus group sp. BfR-BA-01317]